MISPIRQIPNLNRIIRSSERRVRTPMESRLQQQSPPRSPTASIRLSTTTRSRPDIVTKRRKTRLQKYYHRRRRKRCYRVPVHLLADQIPGLRRTRPPVSRRFLRRWTRSLPTMSGGRLRIRRVFRGTLRLEGQTPPPPPPPRPGTPLSDRSWFRRRRG